MLDWEEGLWETDPTKKDTDGDGESDASEIAKLKSTEGVDAGFISSYSAENVKLTETDKFSDQLFTVATTLAQSGSVDESTIEKIGASLYEKIQNPTQRKVYTVKNITISNNESKQAIQVYSDSILAIQAKYPLNIDITGIAATSITSDGEIDANAFKKFDPAIAQINGIVKEMLLVKPPYSLSTLHVMIINGFQRLSENLSDIKLVNTDPVVALGAMTQYEKNSATLIEYIAMMGSALTEKLNN